MKRIYHLAFLLFPLLALAQTKDKSKWDVNNPGGPFKEITFNVNEGTWLNLDLSPDGKEIVFDLLGDIYIMPSSGGEAKVLRSGHAFEVQPRFSPDGKKISFTSDAGGGDNIWVMDKDGSNPKQITKETFRLLNNSAWTPDGQYLIARKHFTSTRSAGAGELWMYHISGGSGLQLTPRKNDEQDLNEPSVSPDGRYVYYSEDVYPGGFFQYNKDPNNQIFVIKRFDRERGTSEVVTGGNGSAVRPQISKDGKTLAFIKRVRTKTVLYLRNLETGEEWPIYDRLSKDQMESWTIFGVYTGFSWSPDNKFIFIWSDGKIIRVDANGVNQATPIPFSCTVKQKIYEAVRYSQDLNPEKFKVNVIRQAVTSPDGKWLVFHAAGYLYKKELPNGTPQRLTTGTDFEFYPSFSADGSTLVYTTWNDQNYGNIFKLDFNSLSKPVKISKEKGIYMNPSFSPDKKWVVYDKDNGNLIIGNTFNVQSGIYLLEVATGKTIFVKDNGGNPSFNSTGDRIFYTIVNTLNSTFGSCKLDGSDDRTIFKSTYGNQFVVSPDGNWVSFVDLYKVYVGIFPHTGKPIDLNSSTSDFPVKQVAKDAGINLHWSKDGRQLHYTLGDQYYTINLDERFDFIANKPDSAFKLPEKGITVGLELQADKPEGSIAFTHARVVTMNENEVIENATVLVEKNLIKAIGTNINIPQQAKVIDCTGKTIVPGFIDAHAHAVHFSSTIPQKHWPYYANLAYGVTSLHDPSANSETVFTQSEMVKAGNMVGPRIFSTGTIIYGADGNFKSPINSLADAKSALTRTKAYGAFSVKSYNQPRREQRQMVIQAARDLNLMVVPEGGSFFYHNLTMILDGHTTIEHNLPIATLHDDVIQFWKQAGTAYTPTLIVSYGSVSGEYFWYQHTNVWEKERLLQFTPRFIVDPRSRHRKMIPEEEYTNGHILVSKQLKKLNDAGVTINSGAHGQLQGLGYHWEIWMMQQGGMSNFEALKTATINPAKTLGLDKWIGSLTPGKLADLLVLDKNPLDDIHNTESIKYTMVNGRLYDAALMDEIGNRPKKREPFYWEVNKNVTSFPWHEIEESIQCSCGKH